MKKLSKIILSIIIIVFIALIGGISWFLVSSFDKYNEKIGKLENQINHISTNTTKDEINSNNTVINSAVTNQINSNNTVTNQINTNEIISKKDETNENYYTVKYSASYNTSDVVGGDYEIVSNSTRLNEIIGRLDKIIIPEGYSEKFADSFFENKNLLVVEGGIGSTINELDINQNQVDIEIYEDSPLTTKDTIHTFNLHLIPISKDVKDINVERTVYPGRLY